MTTRAVASAAATVANLGPGFDVVGACLEGPRDSVTAELSDDGEVTLVAVTGDGGRLATGGPNVVTIVARHVLDRFAEPGVGVRLWLDKGLPLGSGMGSSSASAVAAALAVAALVSPEIPKEALLDACREGERLAAGTPHADNVAPCLFGGVVACLPGEGDAIHVLPLPVPEELVLVCVKPEYDVKTSDAREALPEKVALVDAVANVAATTAFVMGLVKGDMGLLSFGCEERLAIPARQGFVRGYAGVVAAAKRAGAVGAGLSGSGPTIYALSDDRQTAAEIAEAMVDAFAEVGATATAVISGIDPDGAQVSLIDV